MSQDMVKFDFGSAEEARGRALLYLDDKVGNSEKQLLRTIDINGTSLKEAIQEEILSGRLIMPEVFEPVFVNVNNLNKKFCWDQIIEFAKKEFRDVVPIEVEGLSKDSFSELAIEQAISQYTTIYKENVYLRSIQELVREIFHRRRESAFQPIYVALFELASLMWRMIRARREDNATDIEFFYQQILNLQPQLPMLCLRHISEVIKSGKAKQWIEMGDFVDAFYLTLKQQQPLLLDSLTFSVKQDIQEWLHQETTSLYQEYFTALLQEDYERAGELKITISNRILCPI